MEIIPESAGEPSSQSRSIAGAATRWPNRVRDVRSLADSQTRLLIAPFATRETLSEYQERGGYSAGRAGWDVVDEVEEAGLVGRGGAAFSTGVKMRSVAERDGPHYLVANGDEGEPLSVKDRWLLRIRPHLVLDGAFRAASAISAAKIFVYVSDALAVASVTEALEELGPTPVPVEIFRVAPSYVGGEETAAVRAINGGPALPTDKPPRPFESGVEGQPTLVINVETLANIPAIDRESAQAYLDASFDRASPGTFLMTLSGACRRPGLYEVPLGSTIDDVIEATGGYVGEPRGALMGGFFGGVIGPRFRTLSLSYPVLRAEGTGLGCGAIRVLGEADCPVLVAREVMAFFEANNARQCGPCIRGTLGMRTVLNHLSLGTASEEELEKLKGWTNSLRHRGACAHLDGAANLAATLFREFPAEIDLHASFGCPTCRLERDEPSRLRFSLDESTL